MGTALRNYGQPHKSRHEVYVEGLMDGKTKKQAALDAGWPEHQAREACRYADGPITQQLLRESMDRAGLTIDVLSAKMREGLDAQKPVVLSGGMNAPATMTMVDDFDARLKFIQHAHKMLGVISGSEDREAPTVQVNIVRVGGRE